MRYRATLILAVVALSTDCSGDVRATGKSTGPQPTCTISSLRALIGTDSSVLRRVDRTLPPGQSTEGGQAAVFYAGSAPRLISATYFGEMGRAEELYYLLDSLSFVRIRTELRYAQPITVERNPSISSTSSDTVWICEGYAQAAADSAVVQSAIASVRELIGAP